MDEQQTAMIKCLAFMGGAVIAAALATAVLLLISIWCDVGLPTAFIIQFIAGFLGGAWMVWKLI